MQEDIRCLQSKGIKTSTSMILRHDFAREFIQKIWQKLVKMLLLDANEIQVIQKVDRHGHQYWQAYDHLTGKSFTSGSEVDIRLWIEQIYRYQGYDRTHTSNW